MYVRLFVLPLPCLHARYNFPQPGPCNLASTRTCTATCPLPGYSSEGKLCLFFACLCRACMLAATFRNRGLGARAARSCGHDYWESGIMRRPALQLARPSSEIDIAAPAKVRQRIFSQKRRVSGAEPAPRGGSGSSAACCPLTFASSYLCFR